MKLFKRGFRFFHRRRWLASTLLIFLFDFSTYSAFKRGDGVALFPHQDKVLHALAFAVLFFWGYFTLNADFKPKVRRWSFAIAGWTAFCCALYGGLIELGQKMTTYRDASWGDMAADGVGILLGALLVALLKPYPEVENG
ncbi:MAG: VanZ family protein [Acidobacteria bacterium]|nr:VanZ family protein [Acidobacteriota bacterium]MCB9398450.1 VanZ family protein [Acidobacteriota bacterium]